MELTSAQLHCFSSCQQDRVKFAMLVLLTVRKYEVMLYAFFWVIPWRLNFMFRRFGTFYPIFIGRVFEDGNDSVPKRRHIKFRRRGITQGKEYKRWNRHVPKRRHIKFRRQGITQEKEYKRWNRQCSETSVHKIQTPGNHPKSIQ